MVPGDIVDVRHPALNLPTFNPEIARGGNEQSYLTEEPKWIDPCSFARVISSEEIYEELVPLRGRKTPVPVKFANAEIRCADGTIARILYLPDFLSAPKPELMKDQAVALGVRARQEADKILFRQKEELALIKQKLDSMKQDKEIKRRLEAIQKYESDNQAGKPETEQVPTKEEIAEHKKALQPYQELCNLYEKKHQRYHKMRNTLIENSRYTNAACLRYAYALTVHRAQRLKLSPRMLLDGKSAHDTDNPATDSYFRFLYTATTCTSNELQIMNYPELTPLSKTRWGFENVRILPITFKPRVHYQQNRIADELASLPDGFSSSEPKLLALLLTIQELTSDGGADWCIESIKHLQYTERYSLTGTKGKVTVDFFYNKKHEVSIGSIRVKGNGPLELESEITKLLTTPPIFKEKNIADAVEILKHHLSARNWTIVSVDENKFRVYLIAKHDAGKVRLEVDVRADTLSSKKGGISRIQVLEADSAETANQFETDFSHG